MSKFFSKVIAVVDWFKVPTNRHKVYDALSTVAPLFVAVGLLTNDQVAAILNVAGGVLLFGATRLARHHVNTDEAVTDPKA